MIPRGRQMDNRRNTTTSFIRDAALRELNATGHSVLTMEGVARASFCSIGSVYARYDNRSALFADLLETVISPVVRGLGSGEADRAGTLSAAMEGEAADAVRALVELALSSRHDPALRDAARASVAALADAIDTEGHEGIRWLVLAVVLGCHFLTAAGCDVPPMAHDLDVFVSRMIDRAGSTPVVASAQIPVRNPVSPAPKSDDDVAEALSAEARRALAEKGITGANLKTIAERTGVTTGAVYRRYESKNELINDAVVRELSPKRYEWTAALAGAFAGENERTPADVLTDQVLALLSNREHALATLEMIHAARVDHRVRDTLTTQFANAAESRRIMFEQLRDAGAAQPDINCTLMGWLIQTAPAGARILLSLDMETSEDDLRGGLQAVVGAILAA